MKFSLSRYQIDWPNHIIGFFSALFGILIAFELEEWRDERNQAEVARIAFENLKKEIQINQTGLHENIANNITHIVTLQNVLPRLDNQLRFIGSPAEADSINLNFGQVVFIEKANADKKTLPLAHIGLGNIVMPIIQSSAWESAKATGALNLMNYEKVLSLSSLYNPPRILEELDEIKNQWRRSDAISSKAELSELLIEMKKAHRAVEEELQTFDQFVNILNAME